MPKYIDADAFKEFAMRCAKEQPRNAKTIVDAYKLCEVVDLFPTAPVRREVHAAWRPVTVWSGFKGFAVPEVSVKCMNKDCLKHSPDGKQHPFCPHCGARMDLDAKGAEG